MVDFLRTHFTGHFFFLPGPIPSIFTGLFEFRTLVLHLSVLVIVIFPPLVASSAEDFHHIFFSYSIYFTFFYCSLLS